MPPNPSSASRFSSQTVTSRPASPASATAWSASQAGFLRLDGTEASVRARQLAPPIATARSSAGRSASARPASTTRAAGTCSGGALRQANAKEPRIVPTTNGSRPTDGSTAVIVVATAARSSTARASVAPARRKSSALAAPRPTSSTWRSSAFSGAPSGTGSTVTSPTLPDARSASSTASRSTPSSSPTSAAPGPRTGAWPSAPSSTGSAITSTPARACGRVAVTANSGGETWGGSVGEELTGSWSPERDQGHQPAISRQRPSGRHRERPPPRR